MGKVAHHDSVRLAEAFPQHQKPPGSIPVIHVLSAGDLKGEVHRFDAKAIRRTTDIQHGLTTECRNPRTHCRRMAHSFLCRRRFTDRPVGWEQRRITATTARYRVSEKNSPAKSLKQDCPLKRPAKVEEGSGLCSLGVSPGRASPVCPSTLGATCAAKETVPTKCQVEVPDLADRPIST